MTSLKFVISSLISFPIAHTSAVSPAFCCASIKSISIMPQVPFSFPLPGDLTSKVFKSLSFHVGSSSSDWFPDYAIETHFATPLLYYPLLYLCHSLKLSNSMMILFYYYLSPSSSSALFQVLDSLKQGPLLTHSLWHLQPFKKFCTW